MQGLERGEGERAVRFLVRYLSEYLFSAGGRWITFTGTDPVDATLVRLTLAANISHIPLADAGGWHGLDEPAAFPRPLTVSAAARSLGLPFETVRSRMQRLRRNGLIGGGRAELIAIAPLAAMPGFAGFVAGEGKAFAKLVAEIARDYDPLQQMSLAAAALDRLPPAVVARLTNDYSLRCVEDFIVAHGNMLAAVVLNGLVMANVRPILADPELSKRFASEEEVPPDELRAPISSRALARELGVPPETVRRQIQALVAEGAVEARGREGWIVPARRLVAADFAQRNRHVVRFFFRTLDRAMRLAVETR